MRTTGRFGSMICSKTWLPRERDQAQGKEKKGTPQQTVGDDEGDGQHWNSLKPRTGEMDDEPVVRKLQHRR